MFPIRKRTTASRFLLALLVELTVPGASLQAQVSEGNADKDGVLVPVFPVPRGSAEILNSGDASVSVPLSLPPGVRGMAPSMSMKYSSAATDVGVGAGWSLELGYPDAIRRSTRFGPPRYGAGDTLVLDGQVLVPQSSSAGGTRYATRIDSSRRIVFSGDHFVVTERDGIRLEYGSTAGSKSALPGKGVYAWHLSRVRDPLGNSIELVYEGPDEARRLSSIRYTLDANGNPIGQEQRVVLRWEVRPDPRMTASYGAPVEQDHRLQSIETYSSSTLVRTFELCYRGQACASLPEPDKGHSLLDSIQEVAADGSATPPHRFRYQSRSPGFRQDSSNKTPLAFIHHWFDPNRNQWRLTDTGVRMADVNGDGLVDLLHSNPYTFGHKGHGEVYLYDPQASVNRWTLASEWKIPEQFVTEDAFLNVLDLGVRVLDVNGDGLADLLRANGAFRAVRLNNGSGWNDPGEYVLPDDIEFVITNGFTSEDRGVRTADVNGDGLPDLLRGRRNQGERAVYLNNGENGWTHAPAGSFELPLDFTDPDDPIRTDTGVRLIDVNADGLVDLVRAFNDGGFVREVWLNTGSGWELSSWAFPVPFFNIQWIPGLGWFHFDFGVQVADLDGDRYPDVVFAIPGENNQDIFLNDQHGGFARVDWQVPVALVAQVFTSAVNWYYADNGVRIVDVNGDGVADLVQGALVNGGGEARTFLGEGAIADLLVEYTNPLGGEAHITYGRVSGLGSGPGRMPFQRTVATGIREDGGFDTEMVTSLDFADGYYEWRKRDFRGFRNITETYADGTRREREFYVDEGRKGFLRRETRRDNDGLAFERHDWLFTTSVTGGVYRTFLARETLTQFHQDSESELVFKTSSYTYDAYGNRETIRERDWGTLERECEPFKPPVCDDVMRPGPVRRAERRVYAVNEGSWIVSLPARIERYEGDFDELLSVEEHYYDGLGLGQVSLGLETTRVLRDRRLEGLLLYGSHGVPGPVSPGSSVIVTAFEHDAYGNVVLERNGRGFATHKDYAPNGYLFAFSTRRDNPGGPVIERKTLYDRALGVLRSDTDANGNTVSYDYDGLGRLVSITQPDDPPGDPTVRVDYHLGAQPAYMEIEERIDEQRSRIVRKFVDGLGRPKAVVRGSHSTWVVSDLTRYDNRGRRQRLYEPFFQDSASFVDSGPSLSHSTTYAYEDDKIAVTTHPGGVQSRTLYRAGMVLETDENGERTTRRFDAFGLLRELTNAVGTTRYSYDGLGGLSSAVDPRGLRTEFFYDARGLLRGVNAADGAQTRRNGYEIWNDYDEQGNHTYHWSGSDVWRRHYDGLDRETALYASRDFDHAFKADHVYLYDRAANGKGRLGIVAGYGPPATWNVIDYDERGRPQREQFFFGNLDPALTHVTIAYAYNRQGDVVRVQDPRGRWIDYARNDLGQVQSAGGRPAIRYDNMWPDRIADIRYDASGRTQRVDYGHGISQEMLYDPRGRMTAIRGTGPLHATYTYDPAGNLRSETGRGASLSYEYDGLHRLTGITGQVRTHTVALTYRYDPSGNLLSVTGAGAEDATYDYVPATNRLRLVKLGDGPTLTVDYDPKGNLTGVNDGVLGVFSRHYAYDALGRLRSYETERRSGSIVYDGRGRKVRRTLAGGGKDIYFHTSGGSVLATYETDPSGGRWTTYLLANGKRLALIDDEDTFAYVHSDRLGTVRALSAYEPPLTGCIDEETGKPIPCPPRFELLWRAYYLPFGTEVESQGVGDHFRFTGQELDRGAELYDYGSRYYDPLLRRFLQIDSFLGVPNDPRTLNRYSYALDNPLTYVDPTGNQACDPETDPECPEEPEPAPKPPPQDPPKRQQSVPTVPLTTAAVDGTTQPLVTVARILPPETKVVQGVYGPVLLVEQTKTVPASVFDVKVSFYTLGFSLRHGAQLDTQVPIIPGVISANKDGFTLGGGVFEMSRDGVYMFGVGATMGTEQLTLFTAPGFGTPVFRAQVTTLFSNGASTSKIIKLK